MFVFNILKAFMVQSILLPNGISTHELNRQPPVIISNFKNTYYLSESAETSITLVCNASGRPIPKITWLRNERPINNKESSEPGIIELLISNPDAFGKFQCSARNSHGLSVSSMFEIRKAELLPFGGRHSSNIASVKLHESVSLQCYGRPTCYPGCYVEWKMSEGTERSVISSPRISIDQEGYVVNDIRTFIVEVLEKRTLHLLHTLKSDGDKSAVYSCGLFNKMLRGFMKSPITTTIDVSTDDAVENVPLKLLYNKNVTGTIGKSATLQCIFSGRPLPTIAWSFENKVLDPASNGDIMFDTFNNEAENRRKLIIKVLRLDHHGSYQCTASQLIPGNNRSKTVDIYLKVTGPPKFSEELHPKIQSENSNVTMTCRAHSLPGNPPPEKPVWYQNNRIIDQFDVRYIRKSSDDTELTLVNVNMSSTSNIKCGVSNDYATIYSETYLTVVEKIHILNHPKRKLKLSLEKVETISINATSDPELELSYTWKFKQIDGTLHLQPSLPHFLQTSSDRRNLTIDIQRLAKRDVSKAIGVLTVNVSHRYDFKTIDISTDLDEELKNKDVIVSNKPPKILVVTPGASYNIYVNAEENPLSTTRYTWSFTDGNGAVFRQANLPNFFHLSSDGKNLTVKGTDLSSFILSPSVLSINISNDFSYRSFDVVIKINYNDDEGNVHEWSEWTSCVSNGSSKLKYRRRCDLPTQNCTEQRPCTLASTASDDDDVNYIPYIVIAVVLVLALIGILAGILIYRKMKRKKQSMTVNRIDRADSRDAPSQPIKPKESASVSVN